MKGSSSKKLILAFACLGIVATASSPGLGDETDQLIERALKVSGVKGQLEHLTKTILSTIPSDSLPDSRAMKNSLESLTDHDGRAALQAIVHRTVREEYRKERIEQVISFYSSKVGTKVGRIVAGALDPQVLQEVREGQAVLAKCGASRRSTLERILLAEQAAEVNERLVKTFVRGLLEGYDKARPEGEDPFIQTVETLQAVADRISRNERTREVALAAYAYMFRSLQDEELEQLATYCQSDEASWFRNVTLKGMNLAVHRTASEIGKRLAPVGER
jgi:hypothetical protein